MIVKRIWTSVSSDRTKVRGWQGWFLFGFIPLYIQQLTVRTV